MKENIINVFLNETSGLYFYASNLLIGDAPKYADADMICSCIKNGAKKYSEIATQLHYDKNGELTKKLDILLKMGIIEKTAPINDINNKKKAKYEIKDRVLRFYYTYIYQNRSSLKMIPPQQFYNIYIEPSLNEYISRRFEEQIREYVQLEMYNGKYQNVSNIGTYYYDDIKNKTNGEFDVAIEYADKSYELIETKFYKNPMPKSEMLEEIAQVQIVPNLKIKQISFLCSAGYEEPTANCIDPKDIYN